MLKKFFYNRGCEFCNTFLSLNRPPIESPKTTHCTIRSRDQKPNQQIAIFFQNASCSSPPSEKKYIFAKNLTIKMEKSFQEIISFDTHSKANLPPFADFEKKSSASQETQLFFKKKTTFVRI